MATQYDSAIASAAQRYRIDPGIFARLIQQESAGDPNAVSSAGARGLAQLMPGTAAGLGVDASDPQQNLDGGARYLRQMLDRYGGDYRLALAAYNAGPGAVDEYGDVPPYAETQQYVTGVLGSGPAAVQQQVSQPVAQPAQQPAGSPPVVSQPSTAQSVLTGDDLIKLMTWLYQQQQSAALAPSQTTGYAPASLTGGDAGAFNPTFAREQFNAQQQNANRQYALDAQRFGLNVAQQAYTQRMGEIQALTNLQGPGDWLKYNYAIHNLPYSGQANPTPQQAAGGSMDLGGMASWAQQQGTTVGGTPNTSQQVAVPPGTPNYVSQGMDANGNITYGAPTGYQGGAPRANVVPVAAPPTYQPPPTVSTSWAQPSQATNPGQYRSEGDTMMDAQNQRAAALAAAQGNAPTPIPHDAYGGGSAQMVPQLAMGGQANMAVVGDQQRGQRGPNPELAMSASPITVMPFNRMPESVMRYMDQMPHAATGGTIDQNAPWFSGLSGGGNPGFGASGLGSALGQQPFSYQNYMHLLPSEQQMLQGYVNSPTGVGGAGGYFPDELARSMRGAATGNSYEWQGPSTYGG